VAATGVVTISNHDHVGTGQRLDGIGHRGPLACSTGVARRHVAGASEGVRILLALHDPHLNSGGDRDDDLGQPVQGPSHSRHRPGAPLAVGGHLEEPLRFGAVDVKQNGAVLVDVGVGGDRLAFAVHRRRPQVGHSQADGVDDGVDLAAGEAVQNDPAFVALGYRQRRCVVVVCRTAGHGRRADPADAGEALEHEIERGHLPHRP
jgi:hypothetical protein